MIVGDALANSMQIDARLATPGTLFVAMKGGEAYLAQAAANGAVAAIVHTDEGRSTAESLGLAVAQFPLEDYADTIWRICDEFFEHPTRHMKVIGVTGTNGKTTTAWLIRDMLQANGYRSAYLGTLGFQLPDHQRELANTTPFAVELYNLLHEAKCAGVDAVAMEVSSHALAERRVDGVEFDVAAFTNLTQDHLDFHGTMEAYESAKRRLFFDLPGQTAKPFVAVFNVGDPVGRRWSEAYPSAQVRFAVMPRLAPFGKLAAGLDLEACALDVGLDRIHLVVQTDRDGDVGFIAPLGGAYNVENLATAVASVHALGVPLSGINDWGADVRPVPGRFEPVANDRGIHILVDYAHTPDALEKLLDTVRSLAHGRVITVFGCGGDRDRTKRPLMARAASVRSDLTVITSDNPRTEDPNSILRDVAAGIDSGRESVQIVNRDEAIAYAVREAKPGDVVVIAGKGHENYQIIGREKFPMDDRELARAAL